MFGPEVLLHELLRNLVFANGVLELVNTLVCLSLGLIALDVQINLAHEELAEALLLVLLGWVLEVGVIQLVLETLDALLAGDHCLVSEVQGAEEVLQVYQRVADVQTQLWENCN